MKKLPAVINDQIHLENIIMKWLEVIKTQIILQNKKHFTEMLNNDLTVPLVIN